MKDYFIIQWLGSDRYYVKKTYCGRIILSSHRIDARYFSKEGVENYLKLLNKIDDFNKLEIRKLS